MHVVGANVCRGDGQAPLPTGRLLYTERQQRKMGVRSGSLLHGDLPRLSHRRLCEVAFWHVSSVTL